MGLIARNPQHDQREQGSGELTDPPPAHATGVVHHDAVADDGTVTHHTQRFEAGELVEWSLDAGPGPWALVRPGPPTLRCPTGRATPEEVAAVQVRMGDELHELPPLDDLPLAAFAGTELVPDATARVHFELLGSPVGRILCDLRYQDGRRVQGRVVAEWPEETAEGEPAHDAPLVTLGLTYPNYLRLRTGERTALEAVADGGDVGDTRWTLLLLVHGIIQQEPYAAAFRSLPVFPPELGWWGQAAPYVAPDAEPH
jgi:hypothetical protein